MAVLTDTTATRHENKQNFLASVGFKAGTALDLTDVTLTGATALGAVTATELTISSGVVTRTQQNHTIDTESDAASDDLDTLTGAEVDSVITVVRPASAARTVVIKHGTNIKCHGSRDISLAEAEDFAVLVGNGTTAAAFGCTKATNGSGLGSALAAVTTGLGASLIGIEDSAAIITATNVETALAELAKYVPVALADPGTGQAIPVTRSATVMITQNGAETNTVADPTFVGQRLNIIVDTDTSGARVITFASAINQTGNNTATFTEVKDMLCLVAMKVAGALIWRVVANDGAALSTV